MTTRYNFKVRPCLIQGYSLIEWGDSEPLGGFPRSLQVETQIAHLWAASENMLAALEYAVGLLTRLAGPSTIVIHPFLRNVQTLIAKAKNSAARLDRKVI